MSWLHRYPTRTTLGFALGATMGLTVGVWAVVSGAWAIAPWALAWITSLNLTTFGVYGVDKWQAKRQGFRIPEKCLLLLALIGGTAGAIAAMWVFRHKTVKASFRLAFWLLLAVQAGLIALGVKWVVF
jgi:uncharacterized membrane protein YsdA (DUF1294 family)